MNKKALIFGSIALLGAGAVAYYFYKKSKEKVVYQVSGGGSQIVKIED